MKYNLTAEELILSLVLINGTEVAYAFKEEAFGNTPEEVMDVYLDSASYGLISKGLLELNEAGEKVEPRFKAFLESLKGVPRVIRATLAQDEDVQHISVYCGASAYTIQKSTYQSRVHEFTHVEGRSQILDQMDIHLDAHEDGPFYVEEPIFEEVVDRLMAGEPLTNEQENHFSRNFLLALKQKMGKVSTLFDYQLDGNIHMDSYLYVTHAGLTWWIEQQESLLFVRPIKETDLFDVEKQVLCVDSKRNNA
ncbi:MAG: hypothetical protein ACI4XL_13140 [Bacillus sp. (in: firmicutes)]